MHDRNVLSLVKGCTGFALISLASLVATPVLADGDNQPLLLSMVAPSTAVSIDNTLAVHEVRPAPIVARTVDLTVQPDDLWVRLRHGFAMTNLDDGDDRGGPGQRCAGDGGVTHTTAAEDGHRIAT